MEKKELEIIKGKKVMGTDGRVGTVYKLYKQSGKTFVAIEYAKNDFGMFKLSEVTLV